MINKGKKERNNNLEKIYQSKKLNLLNNLIWQNLQKIWEKKVFLRLLILLSVQCMFTKLKRKVSQFSEIFMLCKTTCFVLILNK